jgi:predicted nucleotidyltransferase
VKKSSNNLTKISTKLAKKYNLSFVRLFGSYRLNPNLARDVDIVIFPPLTQQKDTLALIKDLEFLFRKPVDLTMLSSHTSPTLAREIAKNSQAIFEDKTNGRRNYITIMDTLLAKADEYCLYNSQKFRISEMEKKIRKLKND